MLSHKRVLQFAQTALLVLLPLSFGACGSGSNELQDVTITQDNQSEIFQELRNGNELTPAEYDLLERYRVRQDLPEGIDLPSGLTVRRMLDDQRNYEARADTGGDGTAGEGTAASSPPDDQSAGSTPSSDNGRNDRTPTPPAGSSSSSRPTGDRPADRTPPPPPKPVKIEVPAGTEFQVRLAESLSSRTNTSGERFEAILDDDLEIDGTVVAPSGSRVWGRLSEVKSSGKVKGRAGMALRLEKLVVGDDEYALDSNTLRFQAEGSRKGDAKKIGIGAGVGAVIGAIAGGKKGAAIGAGVGAGAGTGAVLMTKGKEVEFSSEQTFEFKLEDSVEIQVRR